MWTTSNSRAETGRGEGRLLLLLLLLAACAIAVACASGPVGAPEIAPDSPRPARPGSALSSVDVPATTADAQARPVELQAVRLRRVQGDTLLMRLAGVSSARSGAGDAAIEVTTAAPLGNLERTASPEIYVNGARVGDTWAFPPTRLVVVTNAAALREGMVISVAWLGDEERTRSRRPITLTREHLQAIR